MFWTDREAGLDSKPFISDGDSTYTFKDVFHLGDKLFAQCDRGVVLILCKKNFETVVAYCGALRNNIVPLLVDSLTSAESITELVELYQVEYIVSATEFDMPGYKVSGVLKSVCLLERVKPASSVISDELCLLLPTSGSTGDPKCVRMSSTNLSSATQSIVRYMEMTSDRKSISSLPLHYTFGLSVLNCALESRSQFVLTDLSWLDRDFWGLVEHHEVTDLSGVPFMFEILRRVKLKESILENLVCVNQAGGRLDPKLTEYFLNLFEPKNITYLTMYGQTEASPRISYVPVEQARNKIGSIGIPLDIGTLKTDSPDEKSEGELIYSGPNVCLGYAKSRDDLSLGDANFGVLHTGDIGVIDSDGFATIVGRKKRFAKVFGMSVNLDALEALAKSVVEQSAVIARDDHVVVVESEGKAKELREYLLTRVSFPARSLKCITVEELPFKSSGKLDYQYLMTELL